MIVGLCNSRWKYLRIDTWDWFRLLSLASAYGWRPLGSLQPEGYRSIHGWDDENYFKKDEAVTDNDAIRIAAAIQLAIIDIKDSPHQEEKDREIKKQKIESLFGDTPRRILGTTSEYSPKQEENKRKRIERDLKNLFDDYPQFPQEGIDEEECLALQMGFKRCDIGWLKDFAKFCLQGKFKII